MSNRCLFKCHHFLPEVIDIYQAVLPIILNHLEQPQNAKSLAGNLQVRLGQMQNWLNRAVAKGRVKKMTKPVAYVINHKVTQPSLLNS